jgi:hypothetical protein
MSKQSNQHEWVGGPEKRKQELRLLSSVPFSVEETAALCEQLKGFVAAFNDTFGPGRLLWTNGNTSGTRELRQLAEKIALIEGRADGKAMTWELMAISRILNSLDRALKARCRAWVDSRLRWLDPGPAYQRYTALQTKYQSCIERLRRVPPDAVVTKLDLLIEMSSQSGTSSDLDASGPVLPHS